MPNRFRPQVLPDYTPRTRPGEELGQAIDQFQHGKRLEAEEERRQREEARRDRQESRLDAETARRALREDMILDQELRERGLAHVQPREMQASQRARQESRPEFQGRDPFDRPTAEPGAPVDSRPGFFRDELDPTDIRGAFQAQAQAGAAAQEAVILPGQFRRGHGFSDRPVFLDEARDFQLEERIGGPARVQLGGLEFAQVGPTPEERERERARARMQALVEAGVPESVAGFAAEDDVLARQYLGPREAPEERITAQDMVAAGVRPDVAQAAEKDPVLARQLVRDATRPGPATGGGTRYSQSDLEAIGVPEDLARMGARDPVLARQLVSRHTGGTDSSQLPADVRERRSAIVSELQGHGQRLIEPWQQGIADRLAGIGPNGQLQQPMSAEEIIQGFEAAGTNEEAMNQIRRFLRPFTLRR